MENSVEESFACKFPGLWKRVQGDRKKGGTAYGFSTRYPYRTCSCLVYRTEQYAESLHGFYRRMVALRQGGSIQDTNRAIANQNDVLAQIRMVGENYPELLSSKQFLNLQSEIVSENEDLAAAKRIVNSNVRVFNQAVVSFPTSLVAGIKGLGKVDFLHEDLEGKRSLEDLDYNID